METHAKLIKNHTYTHLVITTKYKLGKSNFLFSIIMESEQRFLHQLRLHRIDPLPCQISKSWAVKRWSMDGWKLSSISFSSAKSWASFINCWQWAFQWWKFTLTISISPIIFDLFQFHFLIQKTDASVNFLDIHIKREQFVMGFQRSFFLMSCKGLFEVMFSAK